MPRDYRGLFTQTNIHSITFDNADEPILSLCLRSKLASASPSSSKLSAPEPISTDVFRQTDTFVPPTLWPFNVQDVLADRSSAQSVACAQPRSNTEQAFHNNTWPVVSRKLEAPNTQ